MARPKLDRPNYKLAERGGRFHVEWWAEGRSHRVPCGTTSRAEAEAFLAQFIAGASTPAAPAATTISVILDGYLADRKERVAAYDTLEAAVAALQRHLGGLLPEHVTKEVARLYRRQRHAEGYQVGPPDARRTKPVKDGTVIRELVTLRAAIRWAVSAKWIPADAEPYIETPSTPPPRDRWLTREEATALLGSCGLFHVRVFVALALYTLARSGAILDLRWDRVDLVRRTIDYGQGHGNKRRVVAPINDPLLETLQVARELAVSDWVVEFAGRQVGSIKTGFAAACKRAGLKGVTPHILRHTGATWMAQDGVPMRDIAGLLGHGNTSTTERVYAKHHPD